MYVQYIIFHIFSIQNAADTICEVFLWRPKLDIVQHTLAHLAQNSHYGAHAFLLLHSFKAAAGGPGSLRSLLCQRQQQHQATPPSRHHTAIIITTTTKCPYLYTLVTLKLPLHNQQQPTPTKNTKKDTLRHFFGGGIGFYLVYYSAMLSLYLYL